ncbi:hypothetical protein SERLA73DRAFT_77130 [Serpula lacrymans var. lacrymans S7.3]|uniref:Spt20-like SEP domain-containing protein n=1 Tax=Serpula lacrymans var. lacrymans (strain S7.3) TaxID=936435 RepID=F8Q964_SERL3|nr:hypothetical protein SERLA73DRAFT_77130 [Serpula lacrymans var. lacrymans S7.3]
MAGYNITRTVEDLLCKYESSPPSFAVHLYPDFWTLNSGPKFLYNNQVASLLDDIRAHRIPVDFLELFDSARVPFYDGCMIVELLDYRPVKAKDPPLEKPEKSRVTLHPDAESLWADICLLNSKLGNPWTDSDALEVEAKILLCTAPPLCLEPDPHLTRIANHVLRVSTPTVPVSLKRKAALITPEEDESDKARRAKIMQFMNPRANRSHTPSYRILDAIQRVKEGRLLPSAPPSQVQAQAPPQPTASTSLQPTSTLAPTPASTSTPQPPANQPLPPSSAPIPNRPPTTDGTDPRKLKARKTTQSPYQVPADLKPTPTPIPHPTVNQLQQSGVMLQQSPPSTSRSPLPPTYPPPHASSDPTKPASSPAPQRYTQSPQSQSSQQTLQPLQASPHVQGAQLPMASYQPPTAPVHFVSQAVPGQRAVQPKVPTTNTTQTPQPTAQQAGAQPPQTQPQNVPVQLQHMQQVQQMYPPNIQAQIQHFHQVAVAQQRMSQAQTQAQAQVQNGRTTPQGSSSLPRSPMTTNQGVARSSPLVANQQPLSRSPMPAAHATPQLTHPTQHTYPVLPQGFNVNQYRPMATHPQASPHPQTPANNSVQGQQSQDQNQHTAPMMPQYAPMYGYPAMNMGYGIPGRLPPGYTWQMPGMGRGMPNMVNGQISGMQAAGHSQQMPMGVAKATQGSVQGR